MTERLSITISLTSTSGHTITEEAGEIFSSPIDRCGSFADLSHEERDLIGHMLADHANRLTMER